MPIVAERSGREVEIGQINLFIANDLPRSRAVGFGRHHDPFGGYRSVWRLHDPLSTVAFGGYHGAIRIQPCARLLRGGGETANIGERLNCACTRIQKCAGIGCRASASGRFLCIENTNGRAPFGPLFAAFADFTEPFFTNCAMQRSVFFDLAGNCVFFHQVSHEKWRIAQKAEKPLAVSFAQHARQFLRHDPHAAIDKADIAPRAAEADFPGFEQDDIYVPFGKVERRRLPGETATDDNDIGSHGAF